MLLTFFILSRRNNADAFDAATHVCNRHNYQIKAPMTIDKVITVLKQEAQEALAGNYCLSQFKDTLILLQFDCAIFTRLFLYLCSRLRAYTYMNYHPLSTGASHQAYTSEQICSIGKSTTQ